MSMRKTAQPEPLPDHLPDHLGRWLEAVRRRMRAELGARINDEFPQLRGSHRRILQMIPGEGIRITDLAAMAQMTKQSLGEFADWLEQSGFVRSQRDDADRRVRRVFRTDLGDKAAAAAQRAFDSIESQWRQELGPERYDTMKQALRQLGHDSISAGKTGLPVRQCYRPWRQFGLRFSRNARIPSWASGSWLVAAMTSTAYA
jgi:DNA-binding MarR family transcriptional regulator